MKHLLTSLCLSAVLVTACSQQKSPQVKVEQGTPAYELGTSLAGAVPAMDPDSNAVLLTSKNFDMTAGEVLQNLVNSMGTRVEQLKNAPAAQIKAGVKQTADRIALQKILFDAARRAGYSVEKSTADSILATMYAQYGGEDAYLKLLEENGVTMEFVRGQIEESSVINSYLEDVQKEKAAPSEDQLLAAWETSKTDTLATVRHILLLTDDKSDAEKKEIRSSMEKIHARALQGEDFAALAREFTEDQGSKESGGLYENFSRGTMVPAFELAAFTVPVGEISGIVETQYGFHILEIIERTANQKSFDESRDELSELLIAENGSTVIPAHIEELKKEMEVTFVGW